MPVARGAFAVVLVLGWGGCKALDEPFSETFPADGIDRVVIEVESGDITYRAVDTNEFVVRGTSIGRAFTQSAAADSNEWSAEIEGDSLQFSGESKGFGAINVEIEGPAGVDVEAVTPLGNVTLEGADGVHWVESSFFDGIALAGQLSATTLAGMSVEIEPVDPGRVDMTSTGGDVVLAMPYGAPYDFTVTCDEEESYAITDLGFDEWNQYDVSFNGVTGSGSILVEVAVENGFFELREYVDFASE